MQLSVEEDNHSGQLRTGNFLPANAAYQNCHEIISQLQVIIHRFGSVALIMIVTRL